MNLNLRAIATLALGALILKAAPTAAAEAPAVPVPLYKDARQPVDARVEDLLRRMSLEEKVAQLETVWEHRRAFRRP